MCQCDKAIEFRSRSLEYCSLDNALPNHNSLVVQPLLLTLSSLEKDRTSFGLISGISVKELRLGNRLHRCTQKQLHRQNVCLPKFCSPFNMATLSFLALPYTETLFIRYIVNIVNLKIYFFLASGASFKEKQIPKFCYLFY